MSGRIYSPDKSFGENGNGWERGGVEMSIGRGRNEAQGEATAGKDIGTDRWTVCRDRLVWVARVVVM